jgi:hypothetical protein
MAQLAAKEKMGYYPLPESIAHLIRSQLNFQGQGITAIDLFAGCGTALKIIAGDKCTTYGNELNSERYLIAKEKLDHVVHGPAEFVEIDGQASLHYFNPPYDFQAGGGGRLETSFLEATAKHLVVGGLFIGVVPEYMLANWSFGQELTKTHRSIVVRRFPEPEFQTFKQVIIFAIRKRDSEGSNYREIDVLKTASRNGFPVLRQGEFSLAVHPSEIHSFKCGAPTIAAALDESRKYGVLGSKAYQQLTTPVADSMDFVPLMRPMPGHVAMLLAAGMVDGAKLGDLILKGYHYKYIETETRKKTNDDGDDIEETIEIERLANVIVTLDTKTAEITRYDSSKSAEKYESFLDEHLEKLMNAVHSKYRPLYSGEYSDKLALDFKKLHAPGTLPGHPPNGLLEPQKHVVAAILQAFLSGQKGMLLEGDMGTGKTFISISIMLLLTLYTRMSKTVVLCPPHLTRKWKREIEKSGRGFHARGFICESVRDVEKAFAHEGVAFIILGHQVAKNHSPWEPVSKKKQARWTEEREEWQESKSYYGRGEMVVLKEVKTGPRHTCPVCGALIEHENLFHKKGAQTYSNQYKCTECDSPLWTMFPFQKGPRVALAYYIQKKYKDYGFINDEAHETKGGDTNIGHATRWLAGNSRYTLQMTGTLYGGYASSLFNMAHRGLKSFRDLYEWNGVDEFINHHGLRQKITTQNKTKQYRSSSYGYKKQEKTRTEEIPGATPGIVALLLPYTAFLYIEDVTNNLPEYKESQLVIEADPKSESWENLTKEIDGKLRDTAGSLCQKGDMSLISAWMQASLGYMDCPEQGEKFIHPEIHLTIPPVQGEVNLKDNALVDLIKRENSNGNRVLIYVMQANRRDPMPRIGARLKGEKIPYAILRKNTDPSIMPSGKTIKVDNKDREEFVENVVAMGARVMMCSPELVKTGLDLIQFPKIVFLGPHYSVFLIRQSSRRSWRLGQDKPVEVIFAYWKDTRQQDALNHVAKKLRAASLIDGRAVSGLGAMGIEENSFLHKLVAKATESAMPNLPMYELPDMGNIAIKNGFVKKHHQRTETTSRKIVVCERLPFKEWEQAVRRKLDPFNTGKFAEPSKPVEFKPIEIPEGQKGTQLSLF